MNQRKRSWTPWPARHFMSVLLILCIVFTGIPTASAGEASPASLEIGSVSGMPGDPVDVSVAIDPKGYDIYFYNIEIGYDDAVLELVPGEGAVTDESSADNADTFTATPADGSVAIDFYGSDPIADKQNLFTLHFKIKANAVLGDSEVKFNSYNVFDDTSTVNAESADGKVAVFGTAAVGIDSASGHPGDTVEVAVKLNEASTGIASYGMQLDFDPAALEVAGIAGSSGDYFSSNYDNAGGWLKAAWVDAEGGNQTVNAGQTLFTVTFKIKADAESGDKTITINSQSDVSHFTGTDSASVELHKTVTAGKVAVTAWLAPGAPAHLSATAGDEQVSLNWDAVSGAAHYYVYRGTASGTYGGQPLATVTEGTTFLATGLTNGNTYYFAVKAVNDGGEGAFSNEVSAVPSSKNENGSDSGGNSGGGASSEPVTPVTTDTGVEVLVNGKPEKAGTAVTETVNGQAVTTVTVDPQKLEERLAAEGQGAVITIPVDTQSAAVVGELNGQMIKNMERQQATVVLKTGNAIYTLPAGQIDIDAISSQLGQNAELQDIKIRIKIAQPKAEMIEMVEKAAAQGDFTTVVPPLEFTISATFGGTTVDVSKFNAYVERLIAFPADVDPNKITTGVVVDPDGTVRHVPTKVVQIDGKYYAKVNSLTNSTYSIVWHPLEFSDVASHWAKAAVNDMGSRMVIDGAGNGLFHPDYNITRAEFAAIIVRGLGLKLESGATTFPDVRPTDWFSGAIDTAASYHLIQGFEDGTFRPNETITREQAMAIIAKATEITGLKGKLPVASDDLLRPYTDAVDASDWAKNSIADVLQSGIVTGRSSTTLAPQAFISRAEVAAVVERLLQRSGLI